MGNKLEAGPIAGVLIPETQTSVEQGDARALGVQVVVLNSRGEVFVRRDPDGHITEAHVFHIDPPVVGIQFVDELPNRFGSVSGGVLENETIKDTMVRELGEEMEGSYLGLGNVTVLSDVDYFACYQEKNGEANVLAGVVVVYEVGDEEEELFERVGRFWKMDQVIRKASPWAGQKASRMVFRPAFQVAVGILGMMNNGVSKEEIKQHIDMYNQEILGAARMHVRQYGIDLNEGMFGDTA